MKTNDTARYIAEAVHSEDRPRILFTYYVTGRLPFPFDMLRYDACWPASGDDADMLDSHYVSREEFRALRSIKMHSYKRPTVERWASFTWSVGREKL